MPGLYDLPYFQACLTGIMSGQGVLMPDDLGQSHTTPRAILVSFRLELANRIGAVDMDDSVHHAGQLQVCLV